MVNLKVTQSPTVHFVWTQLAGAQVENLTASSTNPLDFRTLGLLDMEKPPTWTEWRVQIGIVNMKYSGSGSSPAPVLR